jgi:lysophospholipid hydrolase
VLEGVLALLERAGATGDEADSDRDGLPLHLEAGNVLIREGDLSDTIYVFLEGSLIVSRNLDGEEVRLTTIDEPGTVVGEMVAMGGGRRTATVTAATPCRLVAFDPDTFHELMAGEPDLAADLASLAVRRAEENELAELLTRHFEITDAGALAATTAAVEWHRLKQGDLLFEAGEDSDRLYFVVRGRLVATRLDPAEEIEERLGVAGRGDVVGEVGLLRGISRTATVRALRDSVLASMDHEAFLDLVDRQPRVMVGMGMKAVARAQGESGRSSPSTVIALAAAPGVDGRRLIEDLGAELSRFGSVEQLSPEAVDRLLGTPGIADSSEGEFGDVRVSRLLHEAEIEADHLLLDLGASAGSWSRRCLGMADRLLVAVPAGAEDEMLDRTLSLLGGCPQGLARTAVLVHSDGSGKPSASARLAERLAADDVLHLRPGAPDVGRVARVAAGRGNVLVLGGGGGRGFAHIGVLRALREFGVAVDIVGGASIGGIIGAAIADGMNPDELVEWAKVHFARPLDYTIPVVGLIKGRRIARSARETFDDRWIEDLLLTYFAVSTDLSASRIHVHRSGPLPLAIRATSAIPGVMPPVPFGNHLLVDGGVLNNLPLDIARDFAPAGQVIGVDIAPPKGPGARSDYGLSVSGWEAMRATRKYPGISAVLLRSMITASMRERDTQVLSGLADCYLDLDIRGISMLAFNDPAGVAQRGYEAAMPMLEAWLEASRSE